MNGQAVLLTAVGIGVTLAFFLGASWLGVAGAMFNLLTPVAAAYLSLRFGWQAGLVVVSVVSLLLLQLTPLFTLTAYLGLFGGASLLLPWLLRQRLSWDRAICYSALASAGLVVMMMAAAVFGGELQFDALIAKLLQTEIDQAMKIYREAGLAESQLQEMGELVKQIADFIQQSFYGLYLAGVLLVQMVCLTLLQRIKKDHYQIYGPEFIRWRLPAGLIWLLIASGFALLVPVAELGSVGRNLLAVLLPLYFLQGLAVVSNFLQRKAYPPILKGMIYVMVFILNPLPLIITGVGVFDLWIDFRRPRKKDI